MDFRARLFGPCGYTDDHAVSRGPVDVGAFLRRVLLFETYILESSSLVEIPALAESIGWDGVIELLASGAVRIHLDAVHMMSGRRDDESEPLNAYSIGSGRIADRSALIERSMRQLDSDIGPGSKSSKRLRKAVADHLQPALSEAGVSRAVDNWKQDVAGNAASVSQAVSMMLSERLHREIRANSVSVDVHLSDDGYYIVESDIGSLGIAAREEREIVERALLGVGNLALGLAYTEEYGALTGMREEDLPLLNSRLAFLRAQLSPEEQEQRFLRVIDIVGLPDLSVAAEEGKVRVKKLLKVRESPECKEFRQWLRTLDETSDTELERMIGGLRSRLGSWAGSRAGKAMRFATTSLAGAIPEIGVATGPAASGLDALVVNKLLQTSGPVVFVSRLYPTLFKR